MTAPDGLVPVLDGTTAEQLKARFPGHAECLRPHLHPGPRYPSSLVVCDQPAHHRLAGFPSAPAPRHAGPEDIGEHVPPEPEDSPGMAWARELRDAQAVADAAGRKLDAAREARQAAHDDVSDAQRDLTAALNVLSEVRDRWPVSADPEPEPPDVLQYVRYLHENWSSHPAGARDAGLVASVLASILDYSAGEGQ